MTPDLDRLAGAKGRRGFVSMELDKGIPLWSLTIRNDLAKPIVVQGTPGELWELIGPIAHVLEMVRDADEKVCAFCGNASTELFPVDARFGAAEVHSGCLEDHGKRQREDAEIRAEVG